MRRLKRILRTLVGYLIQFIEYIEFGHRDILMDKFVMSSSLDGVKVKSDSGYVDAQIAYMTKPYKVYEICFLDGTSIECADDHIFFDSEHNLVYAKDLLPGSSLIGDGCVKIVSDVICHPYKFCMYDVSVNSDEHSYYTSGVLSHNTTTTVIYLLWYLLFNREKNALVVGNKWRTSEEILDKIKKTLVALPFFMKPGIIKNNVHDMTFDNGCRIITTAPGKSAAIGFAINLLYMDEFAHIPSQFIGEFWRSVYPTVSSLKDSRIVISSTPNGQNMFYDMYMAALDGKSSFHAMRVDWWQVPGRDEKWKEQTLSEFSQEYFNQEYNLQFFKGDNLLLDSNELKNLYSVKTKYVSRHISCLNVESMEYKDMERVTFYEDYSKYMTWHPSFLKKDFREELPDLKMSDDYFVLSIDTSKGQSDDYHILNVFKVSQMPIPMLYANRNNIINDTDIFTLVQVGKMRINTVNIETFANIVVSIAFDLFNSEKIYIALELNQQGKLVRNALERHADFWNGMIIYTKNSENGKFEPGIDLTGNKRKVELCEKFKHFVTTQRIIPTCEETYREVSNFGTNEKGTVYRCQTGHDDLAVTCIEASVFFDSFQYDDVAIDKVDRITDREYLRVLNDDVIEYNRKRLGDDGSSINSDLVEFLNS